MLRSVLDTNVVLASQRGQNPSGPNREIVRRWQAGEFTALYTEDIVMEYAEKLLEHGVPEAVIRLFLASIRVLGEKVSVQRFHLAVYPEDADDIAFFAWCGERAGEPYRELRSSLARFAGSL